MIYTTTNYLTSYQKETIRRELWNQEYPACIQLLSAEQFDDYLFPLQDPLHILVKNEHNQILGWYFDFLRENERFFAMIIHKDAQGKGVGSELLRLAKEQRTVLNGWVVPSTSLLKSNGQLYRSPVSFYERNHFCIRKDIQFKSPLMVTIKIEWRKS